MAEFVANNHSIEIDGLVFTVVGKRWEENRRQVKINCDTTGNSFWVYPSVSELGCWRLCLFHHYRHEEEDRSILYKGPDYVQSSFIHLRLQHKIDEVVESLPSIDDGSPEMGCKCPSKVHEVLDKCKPHYRAVATVLNDTGRMVDVAPFEEFHRSDDRRCGEMTNKETLDDLIDQISSKVVLRYQCNFETIEEICPFVKNMVDKNEAFGGTSEVDVIGHIYRAKLISNNKTRIKGLFDTVVAEFKSQKKLGADEAELDKLKRLGLEALRLLNSETDISQPELHVYFFVGNLVNRSVPVYPQTQEEASFISNGLFYKFHRKLNQICRKPKHIFPLFLTTEDSSVNEFGVYTKYVPAGAFICKLFDYLFQCSPEIEPQCTPTYAYIGQRYENMYPFKNIMKLPKFTAAQCVPVPETAPIENIPPPNNNNQNTEGLEGTKGTKRTKRKLEEEEKGGKGKRNRSKKHRLHCRSRQRCYNQKNKTRRRHRRGRNRHHV